jgi:hypothetical protein
VLLDPDVDWQFKTLEAISLVCEGVGDASRNPLRLLSQAVSNCADIGDHLEKSGGGGM